MKDFNKKVAFYTLGCKLNYSETSTISREFVKNGYKKVDFNSEADVYVINTCTVTELADKKCRNAIRKAIKKSPNAIIIAIGCYSQLKPDIIAKIKGVDLILGIDEKFKIFDYLSNNKNIQPIIHTCNVNDLNHFSPSCSINDRTRSFMKIQDGCDYKCAYCTVPLARGKSRNPFILKIIKQAKEIGDSGIKEIVLTGVNIGDFGKSTGETFYELINELEQINTIERFRISSIEPDLLTNEIIEFVNNSSKFVPHFHIPLQSGSNKILNLMQRRYNRELFEERLEKIKSINPYTCVGVDIIVGFPGETQKDFNETKEFLSSLDISYFHVFTFSERANTKAVMMKYKINHQEKARRSKELIKLSEEKRNKFYNKNVGKEVKVLFENQRQKGKMFGFTDNYIKIEANYNEAYIDNITFGILEKINPNNTGKISAII